MRPKIIITMGDPAGIGPEIIVKSFPELARSDADIAVTGCSSSLERAMEQTGISLPLRLIKTTKEIRSGSLNCFDLANLSDYEMGKISGDCGKAAYDYIENAVRRALDPDEGVYAIVTAPIHKESLRAGGVPYIGHTEIIAALTETKNPLTMFQVRGMRIFFLTRHMSLRSAVDGLSREQILDCGRNAVQALRKLGFNRPKVAVAGLNPHCGEHGLFGTEEETIIRPAVEQLAREGLQITGPIGADSVFHQCLQGKYDAVISLYHDQGHIAAKTYDFNRTVSVTCGLPFLRTSVDHGTAFDIAGSGAASPVSLVEAVKTAVAYYQQKTGIL